MMMSRGFLQIRLEWLVMIKAYKELILSVLEERAMVKIYGPFKGQFEYLRGWVDSLARYISEAFNVEVSITVKARGQSHTVEVNPFAESVLEEEK